MQLALAVAVRSISINAYTSYRYRKGKLHFVVSSWSVPRLLIKIETKR